MIAKTFELRDKATFVPVLAVKLEPSNEQDRYILALSGYGQRPQDQAKYIFLMGLNGGLEKATCDPYDWGDRTRSTCHQYLLEHFDELESGAVIDVEFILGETTEPKVSEAL